MISISTKKNPELTCLQLIVSEVMITTKKYCTMHFSWNMIKTLLWRCSFTLRKLMLSYQIKASSEKNLTIQTNSNMTKISLALPCSVSTNMIPNKSSNKCSDKKNHQTKLLNFVSDSISTLFRRSSVSGVSVTNHLKTLKMCYFKYLMTLTFKPNLITFWRRSLTT